MENMTTVEKINKMLTSDLMMIIRSFTNISYIPSITETAMVQLNVYTALYCREHKRVIERTGFILDKLSKEYTEQAFNDSTRSFTVCVHCLWAIMYDDDNETEYRA